MTETNRFALTFETLTELATEIRTADADLRPALPTLSDVLSEFAPLPEEALFLGVANDGLPVLLNLLDPVPGPILIAGDQGSGKTRQLQTIARAVERIHPANYVKYVVVTERPDEWNSMQHLKNCDGTLSPVEPETTKYLSSLAEWAHNNKGETQNILVLIDNLEALIASGEAHQYLRWLLLRGPSCHVWPIVTVDYEKAKNLHSWMDAFHTRLFGHIQDSREAEFLTGHTHFEFKDLLPGSQFAMREGNDWLPFWLPKLD